MITRRQLLPAAGLFFAEPQAAVPPLDASRIRPPQFSDDDLDLPYYLVHFARFANSVRMEPPGRGFIDLSVWRRPADNKPYNARIMENILSLAWFYCTARSWNPYRGDPALRARLEAALEFWCGIQSPEGRFSEYGPQKWNLAATAFAVKFIAEALRLLHGGPAISQAVLKRAAEACRKAIRIVLYDEEWWKFGASVSNQYTNIFAGGPAFLRLYPDTELEKRLRERIEASSADFQSPAGYFYEADGPDFGYNLSTHHENVHMAWHYYRQTPLAQVFIQQQQLFCEWLGYNALPEPGQDFFVLNRAIESRQRHATWGYVDTPVAERCIIARAFATPPEVRTERIRTMRRNLETSWPQLPPLAVGEFWAYSPYRFLQRSHFNWRPTAAEIREARKLIRAWGGGEFTHYRSDSRRPVAFAYLKRKAYYAALASGAVFRPGQRFGLTFVWSPTAGAVLQSQTGSPAAWGTVIPGKDAPFEASRVEIPFPKGTGDLKPGGFKAEYPLEGGGSKLIEFHPESIRVEVRREGPVVERLPMLIRGPSPGAESGWRIQTEAATRYAPEKSTLFGSKRLCVVTLEAQNRLAYEIRL